MRFLIAIVLIIPFVSLSQKELDLTDIELILLSNNPPELISYYGYEQFESKWDEEKATYIFNDDKENSESENWIEFSVYKSHIINVIYTSTRKKVAELLVHIMDSNLYVMDKYETNDNGDIILSFTSEIIGCNFIFYCNKNESHNAISIFRI